MEDNTTESCGLDNDSRDPESIALALGEVETEPIDCTKDDNTLTGNEAVEPGVCENTPLDNSLTGIVEVKPGVCDSTAEKLLKDIELI